MLERTAISWKRICWPGFDRLIGRRGYANRSEAVRDLIREQLVQDEWSRQKRTAPDRSRGSLVYDHDSSSLAQKLTHIPHEHHKSGCRRCTCTRRAQLPSRCSSCAAGQARSSPGESLVSTKGVSRAGCSRHHRPSSEVDHSRSARCRRRRISRGRDFNRPFVLDRASPSATSWSFVTQRYYEAPLVHSSERITHDKASSCAHHSWAGIRCRLWE